MKTASRSAAPRKPRVDAARNRSRLIEVAKAAFARHGAEVSLEEIAASAGVGIGTLYRHFPTRDAIMQAAYRHEVQQLAEAAGRLSATLEPLEALREWMRLFVNYIAVKKIIAPALNSLAGGSSELLAASGAQVRAAVAMLTQRAVASGAIRADLDPLDLLYALFGFVNVNGGPDLEASARRLIDILIAGIRRPGSA